jgi:hypothetical protein
VEERNNMMKTQKKNRFRLFSSKRQFGSNSSPKYHLNSKNPAVQFGSIIGGFALIVIIALVGEVRITKTFIGKSAQKIGVYRFNHLKNQLLKSRTVLTSFNNPEQTQVFDLISKTIQEADLETSHITVNEAFQIFKATKATEKIEGELAEVGTYRGGTAKIICEAKANRPLHLFDTFSGLPKLSARDNPDNFHNGQYACTLENVKNYLKGYSNVSFYKGLFPESAGPIMQKRFAFVHLDVDLYESTFNSLAFFYPRMAKGAILVSHDYLWISAVHQAFTDFFKDKPETVMELADNQCMFVRGGD